MIEVAYPEDSRFHREVGVKLEVAKGDITDVWRFQRATIIRILDCIYAVDTTLVPDSFEDMQEIIHQFAQTATKFGLLVNMQITTSVRLTQAGEEEGTVHPFYKGDHPLQDVNSFPYLDNMHHPRKWYDGGVQYANWTDTWCIFL